MNGRLSGPMAAIVAAACLAAPGPARGAAETAFAGSEVCRSCHEPEWQRWRDSHHYQAMLPATEDSVLGDFNDSVFEYAGLTHRFSREDERFLVRTDNAAGELATFEVLYTFGFDPLQQYLIRFPDGRYQALGIAWDSRPAAAGGQRWYHLYPDERVTHDDPLHWTGSFQNWNSRCATCHSTGLEKRYAAGSDRYDTRWAEINVACEACHGPGRDHSDWALGGHGGPDPGFANALPAAGTWEPHPERPTFRRVTGQDGPSQTGICASCHSRRAELAAPEPGAPFSDLYQLRLLEDGLYYPDGQIRDEVYVLGSFLQSRMHRAGVACTDCHDPHSGRTLAEGNALCARCHRPDVFDRTTHHRHPAGSAGAACVECHMPATTYMGVDARRDHGFRVPEPHLTVAHDIPNACNRCHTDRDARWAARQLAEWYPDRRVRATHAPVLAAARANRRDALPGLLALAADASHSPILRATALLESGRFPDATQLAAVEAGLRESDPLVRAAAARALEAAPPAQRYAMLRPVVDDPARSVRVEVAAQLADLPLAQLPETERAVLAASREDFLQTLRYGADMPEGQLNLGNFHVRSGRPEAAETAYRQALRLSPGYIPAMINLADLYRATGMDGAAEELLEAALQQMPEHAPALHALGLLRIRQGRLAPAAELLGRAAGLAPENPRYAYVYGVALYELGRRDDAIGTLEQALARHPGDPDITAALRAYHQQQDETD